MMLLYRMKNHRTCYLTILIAFVVGVVQYTIASDEFAQLDNLLKSINISRSEENNKNKGHLARVIQAFYEAQKTDDKETKDLVKQWEDYTVSATHYLNTDHLNAIDKQLTEYYKTIADIDDIIKENNAKRKSDYSPSWVDDLNDHFGIAFVRNNRDVIVESLKAAIFTSDEAFEQKLSKIISNKIL